MAIIRPHADGGMRFHHAAWVYPCEFSTSFMPATASAITGVGCAKAGASTADHISDLQLGGISIDLLELARDAGSVERNPQIEILAKLRAHRRGIGGRQQSGPDIFRANRIGLGFLVVLAQIVAGGCHRKTESDDEAEQRQGGGLHEGIIVALGILQGRRRRKAAPICAASHRMINDNRKKTAG